MPQAGSYSQEGGFALNDSDHILIWSAAGHFTWISPLQMAITMQAKIASVFPPSWKTVAGPSYTITDADVGNGLDVTGNAIITIPNTLTGQGTISIRKNFTGTAGVGIAAASGVTLDLPGGRNLLVTQFETMALISMGASNHWTLSGAEQ